MNSQLDFIDSKLLNKIRNISLAMFRKNFFGIFHGSISARLSDEKFLINKKKSLFDDLTPSNLIALNIQKDYRWSESSIDTPIHAQIYQQHKNAKFIAYAMPPYTVSYSLKYPTLRPLDYFGHQILGEEIKIFDPKDYATWYERASEEISQAFHHNPQSFLIIKGYGIYALDRDLHSIAKTVALIENTCKILHYNADLSTLR